ncbi:SAM-dependent methyltransferase [Nonomuraea soli]|uniref:Methyltransferase type 11 domain-containing protein n=1 Tax=Nonomuraea soli TaxID=1032476 RepID=A0A7W0HW93_9ACTN|nr:class I SAM-dependent methyltransferase [Nonomuraea soli]MBA2897970.1 hypothetical protein [Nonomuraea soli]
MAGKARLRRWSWMQAAFPELDKMRVIDLGGTPSFWLRAPVQPEHVKVVNLAEAAENDIPSWISTDVADACDLPKEIAGEHYDLVVSNAVLEHVGGHARRAAFAEAVHTLADRHWVQTPYRYFPVEPHVLFPLYQFLPVHVRAGIIRRWPLVHTNAASREQALRDVFEVELIGVAEMSFLFPSSIIKKERMAGLPKSLIAIKA